MKNAQKGVFKGDYSTRHAQLSFLRNVSGVHKSRLPMPDHKPACSFTPFSQVCLQEGDLKQVQFLKYAEG